MRAEEPTRIIEADELQALLDEVRRLGEEEQPPKPWPSLVRRKSSGMLKAVR